MAADLNPLTVHVLDTASGAPAAELRFELFRVSGSTRDRLGEWRTNSDGRADRALLPPTDFFPGIYEVVFHVADWRAAKHDADSGFYDVITIRFVVVDPASHHHIPLLLAPYGYSTYRGS